MSYTYGPGALLTGPCLVNSCSGNSTVGTYCGASVQICAAGSTAFSNPVDAADVGETCSYNYTSPTTTGSCSFEPLGGKLGGSGNSWSLYDSATTINLTPTTVPENNGATLTILYVSSTSILSHFLTAGAAAASSATATTSTSSTSTTTKSTSTTSTAIYYNTTMAYNTTTVAPSTSAPVSVGTGVTVSALSTGALTSGAASASASTTVTVKNGVGKISAPNVWKSIAIGALVLAACVV